MNIIEFIFKQSFRINILHTLPGRLRVHIPLLKSIIEEFSPTYETIEELLFSAPGIQKVTPNYISGNILITYNPEEIDEESIIHSLKVIWKTMVSNRKHFANLNLERSEILTTRLIKYLKREDINLTKIIGEVKIPSEIWI